MDGLIGYTGFVGGVLSASHAFDLQFNRSNISEIRGKSLELLVCAGAPAVKWLANREPEQDRAAIDALCAHLAHVSCAHVILISTIDVYPLLQGLDEAYDCSVGTNHPYGTHRWMLEQWVRNQFEHVTVVRLPALFGPGLKKNIIFDLLNDNCVEQIQPESVFQWYPLERLWADIEESVRRNVSVVNLFPEPIRTRELVSEVFPEYSTRIGAKAGPPVYYDLRTEHASLWGRSDGYRMSSRQVLESLKQYVASVRCALAEGNAV